VHEFLHELHEQVLADRPDVMTVGEMPGVTVEEARRYTDPDRAEVDMVFQFEHVGLDHGDSKWDVRPLRLVDLKGSLGRWQAGLAETGWNSLYWNNHDQPRAVSRFGDDRPEHRVRSAKLLGTVLHLHRGTPYVYQGDELGMTNYPFAGIEDYRDIESLNHHRDATALGQGPEDVLRSLTAKSRDHARTPMQWDASEHAGFTTGTPWLPANPNKDVVNAAAARTDDDSVFHHYRRLIALRHQHHVVVDGRFELLLPDDEQVWAFTRATDDVTWLVLANCSSEPARVDASGLPAGAAAAVVVLATHPGRTGLDLEPWESRILAL
jgi:oligo-1,6-glucosidase